MAPLGRFEKADSSAGLTFGSPGQLTIVSATPKNPELAAVTFSYILQKVPDKICKIRIFLLPETNGEKYRTLTVGLDDIALKEHPNGSSVKAVVKETGLRFGQRYKVVEEATGCGNDPEPIDRIRLGSPYWLTIPTCLQTTQDNFRLCAPPVPEKLRWTAPVRQNGSDCLWSTRANWSRPVANDTAGHNQHTNLDLRYSITWKKSWILKPVPFDEFVPLEGSKANVAQEATELRDLTTGVYLVEVSACGPAGCSQPASGQITVPDCGSGTRPSDRSDNAVIALSPNAIPNRDPVLANDISSNHVNWAVWGVMGLLIMVFLFVFFVYKRKQHRSSKKDISLVAVTKTSQQPLITGIDNLVYLYRIQHKVYLPASDKHVPFHTLDPKFIRKIAEGYFGSVTEISIRLPGGEAETRVALKQVKDIDEKTERDSLMREILMLKQLPQHKNVVTMVACLEDIPVIYLMMELCDSNLRSRVAKRRLMGYSEYDLVKEFLGYALDTAEGMRHLFNNKIIHRDLAARNVLVTVEGVAKISDFGLSRQMQNRAYYKQISDARVPWKWLAPEALERGFYSTWSDVWAFGVVMWEIFSFGEVPYPDILAADTLLRRLIDDKYVMPKPDLCPETVYQLMLACWAFGERERPDFTFFAGQLSRMLESRTR